MSNPIRGRIRATLGLFPDLLARLGLVDREKANEAFDLAVPVMVTGGFRTLLRTADFFMVSLAIGPAAVTGLQFGFQYFFIGAALSFAVSSGTISVVSRCYGAEDYRRANLAIKQSIWIAILISTPLVLIGWFQAVPLIDLLTNDPAVIALGSAYLQIIMLATPFRFINTIGSRALGGAADTLTPMYINATTLPTNLVLNAVLIFGLGPFPRLGIVGAAVGSAIATALAATIFLAVLASGRFRVRLRVRGRQFDRELIGEIVRVGLPLSGSRLAQAFGRFPFLFVLALLGTNVVAAYAIAERLMFIALMPAWGYSTAASTLVGNSLGRGDDREAEEYGWQSVRITVATQLLIAVLLVVMARPVIALFGEENLALTLEFVYVFAVMTAGFGIERALKGALRGAGDTTYPFYGTVIGDYLVRMSIVVLAIPVGYQLTFFDVSIAPGLGLGMLAVYASILADAYTRAAVNWVRFRSNRWKVVARNAQLRTSGG